VVATALFMSSIDQTMIATALRPLGDDLRAPVNWSAWTISIYALGLLVAMPLGGKISDQIGRKRVFLGAIALFAVASLLCGLATNIYMLVGFRAVQAIGAGVFLPSSTGIIADEFPENRDRMIGTFPTIFPIGAMVGPAVGAFIVDHWSWRATFLVNVPVAIVLLVLGLMYLSPSPKRGSVAIDVPGIALLAGGLLAALYGLSRLGDGPSALVASLLALAVGVVLLALFVRHASRSPSAVIPIDLLRGRTFGVMAALNFLFGSACIAAGVLVPLYAQDRYGMDLVASGALLTIRSVGIVSVAALTVMVLRRTGYRVPMVVGFSIVAASLAILALPPPGSVSPFAWLTVGSALSGLGMGVFVPPANNATLHKMPAQTATVTGVRGMFRQTGLLIGVSVITAIGAASGNAGLAQAWVYGVLAVIVVASLPLIYLVPDHRGKW